MVKPSEDCPDDCPALGKSALSHVLNPGCVFKDAAGVKVQTAKASNAGKKGRMI
jgi:hypothetical protein